MVSRSRYVVIPVPGAISDELVEEMAGALPRWTPDESDPGVYWADFTEEKFVELMKQWNASADQVWVPTATGQGLRDKLLEVGYVATGNETEEELRQIYYDAFVSLAKDSPEWALLQARRASPVVFDVSLDEPANNMINVYCIDIDGESVDPGVRALVQARLNSKGLRPIWLTYMVLAARKTNYTVDATITYIADEGVDEAQIQAQLKAKIIEERKLDNTIYISSLERSLWPTIPEEEGRIQPVLDVQVTAPANNLAGAVDLVYHGSVGTLTFTGV